MRSVCEDDGIPVTGSSFDLRTETDHDGVMRLSAETSGFDFGSLGSERTVIRRGMSWGVCSDMAVNGDDCG